MKLFILLALALASQLSLIVAFRRGTVVTDVTTGPQTYVCQVRSINTAQTEKWNSTGVIYSKRWVGAPKSKIHTAYAAIFAYFGSNIYNGGTTRYLNYNTTNTFGELALLKSEEDIPLSATLKAAPFPTIGQNYGTLPATIIGYGGDDTRNWSQRRKVGNGVIEYNSKFKGTPAAVLDVEMVVSPTPDEATGPCAFTDTDAGSLIVSTLNGAEAVVGLVIANHNNGCAFKCIRLTKYVANINATIQT